MAVTVTCENPECGIVFEVGTEKIGETAFCPKCGSPTLVTGPQVGPAAEAEEAEAAPPAQPAAAGPDDGIMLPPTKQQCPNCGTVIGADLSVCPECGASTRAPAAAAGKEGPDLTPLLIGGGIVVALAVLVGLIVVAVKLLSERGLMAEEPAPPPPPPPPAEPAEPEEALPAVQLPQELLDELAEEEQQLRQAVAAYRERLSEVLADVRRAGGREMAARWADLYVFCRDNGLQTEADQCWLRAATLAPTDAEVNGKLGRTATFAGHPVTPDQKAFLETLGPKVRLVNRDPTLDNHVAGVGGRATEPLGWSAPIKFDVETGPVRVSVQPRSGEGPVRELSMDARRGIAYTITLLQNAAAPAPDFSDLSSLYAVIGQGGAVRGVAVERDWQGNVKSARAGSVSVRGLGDEPVRLQLSRDGAVLTVDALLTIGDAYSDEGADAFRPGADEPLRFAIQPASQQAFMQGGFYYKLRLDLVEGLWGVVGTAQGDLGSEWARRRLAAAMEDVAVETAEREARGEFVGPWQATAHMAERLADLERRVTADRSLQDWAAERPDYLDCVRARGLAQRQERLYLNWPRFRMAMGPVLQDAGPTVFAELKLITEKPEEAPEPAPSRRPARGRRGPPPGYGPSASTGPPEWVREAGFAGTGPREQRRDSVEPPPVELSAAEAVYARLQLAGVLPDGMAMQEVRGSWSGHDMQQRQAAMLALERMASPQAVALLGQVTRESRNTELVTGAMMSLGAIGTPPALEYCEGPAVVPAVRAAALAARAVAGDPDALAELPRFVQSVDPATRESLLNFVTAMDTPGTLPVLSWAIDTYTDSASRNKIALALVRIGGHAAVAELDRLMAKGGDVFPRLLAKLATADLALVKRRIGEALVTRKVGEPGLDFMLREGSPLGRAYVEAAARRGNPAALDHMYRLGTAEALETATGSAGSVDLDKLKELRRWWFDEADGKLAWKGGVDAAAGTAFLHEAMKSAQEAKVKLAVSWMLHQTGQQPDLEILLALAKEPPRDLAPEEAGAPARRGPPRGGPPRRMGGPPPGMRGPPGTAAPTADYKPASFEEPKGAVLLPRGFELDGDVRLYALGMISLRGDEEAMGQLRKLADGYGRIEYRTATLRALANRPMTENLEYVRARAMARSESYERPSVFWDELEDRIAAMLALGEEQDVEFLPNLLDVLHEQTPPEDGIGQLSQDYEDVDGFWRTKLYEGGCKALAAMCAEKQLFDLTADAELQRQIVERLVALIERPVSRKESLATARRDLKAEAIRAFGRCADPYSPDTRIVVNRLAMQVKPAESAPRRGPPDMSRRGRGGRGRGAPRPRASDSSPDALWAAYRDAVAHLAVRGAGLDLLRQTPGLLPSAGSTSGAWSALMRRMADAPTSEYFALLNMVRGSLSPEARRGIFDGVQGKASAYDLGYAQFAAEEIRVSLRRPEAEAAPAGRRASTRTVMPPGMQERIERIREEAIARAMSRVPGRGRPTPREPEAKSVGYSRQGPRRQDDWSYDLGSLARSAAADQKRWEQAAARLKEASSSVLLALGGSGVASLPTYGPAAASLCAERAPSVRSQVLGDLRDVLLGRAASAAGPAVLMPGPRSPGAPAPSSTPSEAGPDTQRAAVSAVRRIGGEEAARILFDALAGPEAPPQPAAGVPVRGGPPPGVRMPPVSRPRGGIPTAAPARPAGRPSVLARLVGRALGSMGRDDLLQAALNAQGRRRFTEDPEAVQRAALEGMAYMPKEKQPIQMLSELLARARTIGLRRAVAEAIQTALRRLF
jgi:hypothetical protein